MSISKKVLYCPQYTKKPNLPPVYYNNVKYYLEDRLKSFSHFDAIQMKLFWTIKSVDDLQFIFMVIEYSLNEYFNRNIIHAIILYYEL